MIWEGGGDGMWKIRLMMEGRREILCESRALLVF